MACLLDCPAELRQQILGHTLPDDVHNAGIAPRTAPLLPLLLTCRAIRLDVLELLRTWSPVYHIEDPAAITNTKTNTTSRRCLDEDGPHMRRISLRLFAGLDLKRMRSWPIDAVVGVFDAQPWLRCAAKLPERAPAVECVTIDLTPAPAWMAAKRPDWVRATILDARNTLFLRGCAEGVRELVAALCESYRGGGAVTVSLGGVVLRKARRDVEGMMVVEEGSTAGRGARFVGFEGEWLSGPSELPTRLSLALLSRCWGLEVDGPSVRVKDWMYDKRTIQIRNEARKEGLATPELNLMALSPVCWSRDSCTAYFINAQEDEGRTREDLVRLLTFAGDVRTEAVQEDAVVNFAPAIRARRFLMHCLAKDLGLASVSVGDAGEKFVRVSQVVEAAADEHELPENSEGCDGDGGGNEEEGDLEVPGEEDSTSSSHRVTRPRRPWRSCCAWGPIERLLRALGDR